jgi:hypothetical protein
MKKLGSWRFGSAKLPKTVATDTRSIVLQQSPFLLEPELLQIETTSIAEGYEF